MPQSATIALANSAQPIRVKIWDVWDEGAGLELPFDIELPKAFTLIFEPAGVVADVKVKLQTGRLVRVAFTRLGAA